MAGTAEWDNERRVATEETGQHEKHRGLPHHAIARREGDGTELLRVPVRGSEEVLPVFSSRWPAQSFLDHVCIGTEWFARECYPSELISLLTGTYAGIEWVLLDPLPGCLASEDRPANLMRSDDFLDYLSGRWTASGNIVAKALVPGAAAAPPASDERPVARQPSSSGTPSPRINSALRGGLSW